MNTYKCRLMYVVALIIQFSVTNVFAADSLNQRYGHLQKLTIERPGVALYDPAVNPFSYDAIHVSDVLVSFADGVEPLSKKHISKINKGIVKWQEKDLKKAGVPLADIGSECTLNMLIRIEQLKYDKEKLRDSEKYRFRGYGNTLISSELRDATEQKVLAVWLRRVALGTEQRDKGSTGAKVAKSLTRSVVDAFSDATENILPEFQKLVAHVDSKYGCQSGIGDGLSAR